MTDNPAIEPKPAQDVMRETEKPLSKIRHRGVFVERQTQEGGGHRYICHTGISKFLPDLYDTQSAAIEAIDARFAALSAPVPSPDGAADSGDAVALAAWAKTPWSGGVRSLEHLNLSPSSSDDVRSALAEAFWRHEAEGVPALKAARGQHSFTDQSETTQAKWMGYAGVALDFCAALRSAPVSAPATDRTTIAQAADEVVQRVEEYDDRTSPDDFPEALLITPSELHTELMRFAEAISSAPAVGVTLEAIKQNIADILIRHQGNAPTPLVGELATILSPAPDATVSEPVAWRWQYAGNDFWEYCTNNGFPPPPAARVEPLYTSLQDVGREATVSARDAVIEDQK